uniref:Uncharacterized protein n=1 Tax=Cacopsylla melanoneura TaxID=428564 RepID=A0A8D8SE93_9HEMI
MSRFTGPVMKNPQLLSNSCSYIVTYVLSKRSVKTISSITKTCMVLVQVLQLMACQVLLLLYQDVLLLVPRHLEYSCQMYQELPHQDPHSNHQVNSTVVEYATSKLQILLNLKITTFIHIVNLRPVHLPIPPTLNPTVAMCVVSRRQTALPLGSM